MYLKQKEIATLGRSELQKEVMGEGFTNHMQVIFHKHRLLKDNDEIWEG